MIGLEPGQDFEHAPLRRIAPERYREFELVGKGGMGVVYLALDTELNRRVAFKMVMPDPKAPKDTPAPETPLEATPPTRDDPESGRSFEELRVRFFQEAWVTGAMEHPGVVPVYELGETEGGIPYYTMRYVKGERTLAQAIRGAEDLDARLALLEPFLKVCDTIGYAHSHGVIHRDLKPENVALGEFGEAIVLDWGLSKMHGRPDVSADRWQERIDRFRQAADLRTVAGALGTPGYMAPEAALGESDEVDEKSDLYSLGAILFEILTGRLPFAFQTFGEYATRILQEDPPQADETNPAVPRELARICRLALAREKEERTPSVARLAGDLRHWQTEGTLERQIESLLENARAELVNVRELSGNVLLWHLDRAVASCNRVLHLRPDHAEAQEIQALIKRLRERGIRERLRGERRSLLQKVGVLVLAAAAVATLVVASVLDDRREEAEQTQRASEARVQAAERAAQTKLREERARLNREIEAERDARARAEARADAVQDRYAESFALVAERHLARGETAHARLAAAKALDVLATPHTWSAMAAADAAWAPSLRLVVPGVQPTALAFSPTTRRLYWADPEGVLREVDAATGEVSRLYRGVPPPIVFLKASRDGARLFVGSGHGYTSVLSTETFGQLALVPHPAAAILAEALDDTQDRGVSALVTTVDGKRAFIGHEDHRIRVWDLETQRLVKVLADHEAAVTALALGPDEKRLYAGDRSGAVLIWDLEGFYVRDRFSLGDDVAIAGLSIPPDRENVFVWSLANRVRLLDLTEYRTFSVFDGEAAPGTAFFLTENRGHAFAAGLDGVLRGWDVGDRKLLGVWGQFGAPVAAAIAPDERLLAVATPEPALRVYDLSMDGPDVALPAAASPHGRRVFRARPDHSLEVVGAGGARRLAGHTATITAVAVDPTGDRALTASLDGTIRTWTADGPERVLTGASDPVTAIAFGSGTRLLAGTLGGLVQHWDAVSGRKAAFPTPEAAPITAVGTDPEGRYLYAASLGGRVYCWNERREEVGSWSLADGEEAALLAVSPDGANACVVTTRGALLVLDSGGGDARRPAIDAAPVAVGWDSPTAIAWWDRSGARWTLDAGRVARGDRRIAGLADAGLPWVLRPARQRLMEAEARFGLYLQGHDIVTVPPGRYLEKDARTEPWSD